MLVGHPQRKIDSFFRYGRRGVKRDSKEAIECPIIKKANLDISIEKPSTIPTLTANAISIAYTSTRMLFERTHHEEVFIGRESEMQAIRIFWQSSAQSDRGSTLYISGVPGNGKTATIKETIRRMRIWHKERKIPVNIAFYNCMMIADLGEFISTLKDMCTDNRRHTLILDEIDQLTAMDEHTVYTFFEWCANNPRVTLIGISNSLDLTDRIVPRLKVKEIEPQLIHYKPYTFEHILGILQHRCSQAKYDLFHPMAVEYCARRAAAIQGDLRKAFDICRSSLDTVEKYAQENFEKNCITLPSELPKVKIPDIQKVIDMVFGNPLLQKIRQLPARQKHLLHTLVQMTEDRQELTINALHDALQLNAQSHRLDAIEKCELNEICTALEDAGIMNVDSREKNASSHYRRLALNLQMDDVKFILSDISLM